MKKIFLFVAITEWLFLGCNTPNSDCCMPNVMSVSPNVLNFSGGFDTKKLNVKSTVGWVLQHIDQLPEWITIDPTNGSADQTEVNAEVIPNPELGTRSHTLTFMAANGDKIQVVINQTNEYSAFMADDTPRWEWEEGARVEKCADHSGMFILDRGDDPGERLFNSDRYKMGRITDLEGGSFEIVAFDAPPKPGKYLHSFIYKNSNNPEPLFLLELFKIQGNTLWFIFKESPTAPERRVVM
ncbi:MAG: BACON domain-containing protein [Bacteroidetes bacterium]|nr:BACON domain-containing protein [Bacteroidota bacterium]